MWKNFVLELHGDRSELPAEDDRETNPGLRRTSSFAVTSRF